MREDNIYLYEESSKYLHECFFVTGDTFENVPKKVEHFYSIDPISQTQVRLNQMIEK